MAVSGIAKARLSIDQLEILLGSAGSPGCPVYSNKLRFPKSETEVVLAASYSTVFSYSGSGKLLGFILDFDSLNVEVKLTIDSTDEIFEFTEQEILDLRYKKGSGEYNMVEAPLWDGNDRKMIFRPSCAIRYDSEVKIEARYTSGSASVDRHLVALTKET